MGSEQVWQCSAHHGSTSLYPVVRFLERQLGLDATETPGQQSRALERAAADAGLEPAEAVPVLADLLSLRGAAPTPARS